jgi:hypothetical protein
LLRIAVVGAPAGRPAVVDGFDGDADASVELASERRDAVAQILRRLRRRANDLRLSRSELGTGGLRIGLLGCRCADLRQSDQRQPQSQTLPR